MRSLISHSFLMCWMEQHFPFTKNGTEWTYDGDQSVDIDESALETLLNKASAITASDEVTEYDDLADFWAG